MLHMQASTLLVNVGKWEILQYLEWNNGINSIFLERVSSVDPCHLNILWMFRENMAGVIGTIRLLDEGKNTRIVFIPKSTPSPDETDKKFTEYFEWVKNYFEESLISDLSVSNKFGDWERVDRTVNKIKQALFSAKNEEDFQAVGLLCRETIVSLAQAIYSVDSHKPAGGISPSETDAKRMIDNYIASELSGSSNEELRKYAKDCYQLANMLQHKRTASYTEAALCVEATHSLLNIISIIAEQKELLKSQ